MKKRIRGNPAGILLFAVLAVYSLVLLYALFWAFLTSLKYQPDFRNNLFGFPRKEFGWAFDNYVRAIRLFYVEVDNGTRMVYMPMMFLYSVVYALGASFVAALLPCVTAYVTTAFPNKISKAVHSVVIMAMILPIVGALPSEIQMSRALGMYDTIWGLWIMRANFLGIYFLVFAARFRGMPREYTEAAYMDGASNFRVLWRIMMPLAANLFATVMLIRFIEFWNDYQTPMIYIPSYPTVAYGLYRFSFTSTNSLNTVPMRLTGCMIMLLPILLVFLLCQKRLMNNVSIGGIKE